jgi:RND family efflux transporter MFP subunit
MTTDKTIDGVNRPMRKTLSTIAILISLGAAACGSKSEEASTPERIDGVTVETVSLTEVGDITESLGVVRAKTVSNVAAKLMATVVAMPVEVGDQVRAGQLVLRLDDREMAAQVQKAAAGLDEIENAIIGAEAGRDGATAQAHLATATYERYVALRERGSVSPQEFDEVEARYHGAIAQKQQAERMVEQMLSRREQARADVQTASAALSWARIVSPIDGVVTARHIDVGSQSVPGMPLLTIEDPRTWRVDTTLDETSLGSIHAGDPVEVLVDSSGIRLEGTVTHVSPALDRQSRSYLVKIDLPAHDMLTTGLTARARFRTGHAKTMSVPASAIVTRGQLTGIWIADPDGIARLRFVKTGRLLGERIEILSGLSEGDRVVTKSSTTLEEGAQIADAMPDSGSES